MTGQPGGFPPRIIDLYHENHAYWRRVAACRTVDKRVFFPGRGDTAGVEAAKAVCSGCPVREICLAFALATYQRDGVWGGTSERERRRLRRERREQVAS